MMKTSIMTALTGIALLLGACATNVTNCGDFQLSNTNAPEESANIHKTVKIAPFENISASSGIRVVYTQGKNSGVAKIATTPSAEEYLKVEVDGKTLHAYYGNKPTDEKGSGKRVINGPTIIYVSSHSLHRVDLSSTSSLTIKNDLSVTGIFNINVSSGAKINAGTVSCSELNIDASSTAEIDMESVRGDVAVDISSSAKLWIGTLSGKRLRADAASTAEIEVGNANCDVIANLSSVSKLRIGEGSGDFLKVNTSSTANAQLDNLNYTSIDADASSASNIILSGKTSNFHKDASSAAKINHKGLKVEPAK